MRTRLFTTILILGAASTSSQDQAAAVQSIDSLASIRSYCDQQESQAKKARSSQTLFSALPQNKDPALDKWQRQPSEKDQQAAADNGNSTASAYQTGGHVAVAFFTFQNEFGNWVNYTDYCYRTDGTLAHIHSRLNSFHGDMTVIRDYFFGQRGNQLALDRHDYQLDTESPKKVDPEFWDFPPPIFLHVSDLPFAKDLP